MTGYTPIFSKIVDSSLWCEPDGVVKVFMTMLAKKDGDNVVRGSAFNISQWAKKTEAEVLEALKILSSPDTKRLEPQPYEGRRIEKVEDGWMILNGATYQKLMVKINRRAYKADHEAERRARIRAEQESSPEPKKVASRFKQPTKDELMGAGLSDSDADRFINYYESKGWMVGKSPMKSWKGAVANWKSNNRNGSEEKHSTGMTDKEILEASQG